MAVELVPHAGEVAISELRVPGLSAGFRFGFAVTPEAVYLPVKKNRIALYEPLCGRRIPVRSIRRVLLAPAPWATRHLLLYAPMFLFLSLMSWVLARDGAQALDIALMAVFIYGLPLVAIVLGAGGRYRLTVELDGEALAFAPRPDDVVRRHKKALALGAQLALVEACRSIGIPVVLDGSLVDHPPA